MGGNALKNTDTIRLEADEYQIFQKKVSAALYKSGFAFRFPEYYRNKESFGDMDISVFVDEKNKNISNVDITKRICKALKYEPNEIVQNSNVVSFDYHRFQIDLIITRDIDEFSWMYEYFSYNDLGNLLGRLMHKCGLKFGHDGVHYIQRNETNDVDFDLHMKDRNKLTIREVLWFLGLSYYDYRIGFDSLEDIFKFVSKSRFFNPDIFLFDNLNHQQRTRDRKRKTYNEFLKWCEDNRETLPKFQFPEKGSNESKDFKRKYSFDFILEHGFWNHYKNLEVKFLEKKLYKSMLNGDIVAELSGLSGKQLGELMAFLREELPLEFVINCSPERFHTELSEKIQKHLEAH